MARIDKSRNKHKSFSLVKKIGITFIIPIFLAIIGALIVMSAGWNYITRGMNIGAAIFAKPIVNVEKKQLEVNNKIIYKPAVGDVLGSLKIASVNMDINIYQGDDEAQLGIGAGHSVYSTIPGEQGKVVLAAHRDGFFAPLEFVKEGDEVIIETDYGKFYYKISKLWIAEADDMTVTAPVNKEMLVMYTCYPFHFIGSAPNRYIVECGFVRAEG